MTEPENLSWRDTMPKERLPRERMAALGVEMLSDTELIAILLNTGSKGRNVLE